MKVLIQSYNTCCQNESGGVQIRIKKYVDAIKRQGIDCDYFSPFLSKVTDFDILHIFKLDIENIALARLAKSNGTKIVLSSIVNCVGEHKIDLYRILKKLPIMTTYKLLFEFISLCDLIIAETTLEKNFLIKHYGVPENLIHVIANGAEDYSNGSDEIFNMFPTNAKKDFVLQVGRFDPNKNQLNVIKALKESQIPVVFIGGADSTDAAYYETCRKEANNNKNFIFLGWLDNDSSLLQSAYSKAKVLLVPSYSETFGLTIIEGAIAGATLAISETLPILAEKRFNNCFTFNPNNLSDIRQQVRNALSCPRDLKFQKDMKDCYNWSGVAKLHIQKYEELLNDTN